MSKKRNLFVPILILAALFSIILILIVTKLIYDKQINAKSTSVSEDVVKAMKIGWNLGNTLDSSSNKEYTQDMKNQFKDKYQLVGTYATQPYTAWDASEATYFSTDKSTGELKWKISKLNSPLDKSCGKFAFQIINNNIDTTEEPVKFTVTKAEFTTKSGQVIKLPDMLGSRSMALKNHVTDYVVEDLRNIPQLSTTSDVIGGTLAITVKIDSYPSVKGDTLTKEVYYETLSGNPVTTKDMIDEVKKEGFGAVRIPVTYFNHIDVDGKIDKEWLNRLGEVVNYVLKDNMYCIINIHHDTGQNGWLKADKSTFDNESIKYKELWTQIAEYFKDYNDKLLFEGYNEILDQENHWANASDESYEAANKLNQIFVETVRGTEGNNKTRFLVVNTYAAGSNKEILKNFKVPSDSVEKHLIAEVHFYGTGKEETKTVIENLNQYLVSTGVPVIIGEFGTTFEKDESERIITETNLITMAKKYNITCFRWDDGNYEQKIGSKSKFAVFDRYELKLYYPDLVNALVKASENK